MNRALVLARQLVEQEFSFLEGYRMLTIHTKEGEQPVDPTWVKEWNDLYLNVDQEVLKAKSWASDNIDYKQKLPTRRGLRRFLGNWIRRSCPLKPVIRSTQIVREPITAEPLEVRREHLSRLMQMVGK